MRLSVGRSKFGLLAAITALLIAVGLLVFKGASALDSTLPNRFLKISDSIATHAAVNYTLGFDTSLSDTIGSVELEICENDPFPGTSCTVPVGLDLSASTLVSQSGTNDFTIDIGDTNAHRIIFTRTPSLLSPISFTFEIDNVINPDSPGSYYARIRTFSGSNGGGIVNNGAGLAFVINGNVNVSTTVPQHIDLCVGVTIVSDDCTNVQGDTVDLGKLQPGATTAGTSQFVVGTNADNGYTVTVSGNTMTSGNNTISALLSLTTSTTNVNQFGMNLRKNNVPNIGSDPTGSGLAAPVGNYAIPDNYIFKTGDVVASASGPDNYRKFTATYIINIDADQPAGYYATTVSYIALGSF